MEKSFKKLKTKDKFSLSKLHKHDHKSSNPLMHISCKFIMCKK